MNRRLHNSLIALSCSAALLAVALLLADPVKSPDAAAPGFATTEQPAQPRAGGHRHRAHALRLPFFSFASRN